MTWKPLNIANSCKNRNRGALQFGGHSLRAGLVTQAYRNGQQERVIAKQTRHKSVVVLRTYEREARLDVDNVSRSLGL